MASCGRRSRDRRGRLDSRSSCQHCGAERVVRNGRADGWQRYYQCRVCGRTFNDLAEDVLLRTDSSASLAPAVRRLGIEHHRISLARDEHRRGPWHIQNVNAYHSRFKARVACFHGVATSYLSNYLGWFRALDSNTQTGAQYAARLALVLASAPIHS